MASSYEPPYRRGSDSRDRDPWSRPSRARIAAQVFTDDATYVDPLGRADGREAIEKTVGAVQDQFPGLRFRLAGAPDAHHDVVRFTWHLGTDDESDLVIGFDVAAAAEDGRFEKVIGFLDRVPAS